MARNVVLNTFESNDLKAANRNNDGLEVLMICNHFVCRRETLFVRMGIYIAVCGGPEKRALVPAGHS